jgi:acyl-CoA synthetase (AMP-forming)/AMP-acid ligase II
MTVSHSTAVPTPSPRVCWRGLGRHHKIALDLYNTRGYLETAFAVMKAALVPVNTNYGYKHN